MKFRVLNINDLDLYKNQIFACYQYSPLVFDSQNPINLYNEDVCKNFIADFVESPDSVVIGLFNSQEEILYALVILDNIREAQGKIGAQGHIVTHKICRGAEKAELFRELLKTIKFDTVYVEVPSCAPLVIAFCKRIGFKKTGFIPNVLPYVNIEKVEKLYDIQILTWRLEDA